MDFCLPWWLKEGQDPLQRNAQLTALASARRWQSALRLVQKAWVQRWQTDDYGCSQVVDAISQCKQWPSALDTIMKAGAPPYALNSFMTSIFSAWRCVLFLAAAGLITCISALLSTLVKGCGTWRQGLHFWHQNSQGSNSACNAVISLLQDDQQWQRAAWCLELMGAKHWEADELSKSSAMNHRTWCCALQLLPTSVDQVTLAMLVTALPWSAGLRALYDWAPRLRAVPDETCYNACASSLLRSGRWRDLLQLCHGEETQHSIVTLNAAAAACADRHDRLAKILIQMNAAAMRSLSIFDT